MKKLSLYLFLLCVLTASCSKDDPASPDPVVDPVDTTHTDTSIIVRAPKAVSKTNSQKVYVHYMSWFENKATSNNGKWGQHWTMANQNPDHTLPNGRQQIASHFYPLIGPYASSDRDVIDYHTLLMKYAGIDGVLVDWYGTHQVYDYPLIKRNTDSLFNRMPSVGLQFAICYEDAALKNVKAIAHIDTLQAARDDFNFLQNRYFGNSQYIKINNQPLLLCFGPQIMKNQSIWEQSFADLSIKPKLLSLWYQGGVTGIAGSGEFSWVYSDHLAGQSNFYSNRASGLNTAFAGAYPGFKDFYATGGWGSTLLLIDHNGKNTLQSTLNLAKNSGLSNVQLITWNDFGEGTMLEPTLDFEYSFLEAIQVYSGVSYTKAELALIFKWYSLKKKYKTNTAVNLKLLKAYYYLVALDVVHAMTIIDGIE